jgi:hypothetical protein
MSDKPDAAAETPIQRAATQACGHQRQAQAAAWRQVPASADGRPRLGKVETLDEALRATGAVGNAPATDIALKPEG